MSIQWFLVSRYLKTKKGKFSLISLFGVLGVFLGVFAIIVVISVMRGFEKEMTKRIVGSEPHIYIVNKDKGKPFIKNAEEILNKINSKNSIKKEIQHLSSYIEAECVVYFNRVTIGGIAFAAEKDFLNAMFANKMSNELTPTDENNFRSVILGKQFGLGNQIFEGDDIEILSAWDLVSSVSSMPRLRQFKVSSMVRTGTYSRDLKYLYLNMEDARNYFSPTKDSVTGIAMLLKDAEDVDNIKTQLMSVIKNRPDLNIETWQDRNSRMLYSLKLERVGMIITLLFIIVIASFSIITSLVLTIESKKKEFVILISMGFNKNNISKMIILLSLIKGAMGAFCGFVLGTTFCFLLEKYHFITLPSIYYDTVLPVWFNLPFYVLIFFVSLFIVLIGTMYPLRMISNMSVTSQLRRD